jgi:phosphoadenosine phosphosulfate reductase
MTPQEILAWALERYRGRITLACSFGGPTGIVALDMVMELDRSTPVFYLDTGLLFPQTYSLVERVAKRYGIEPIAVSPQLDLADQERLFGPQLWGRDPDACCALRKVAPQRAFLQEFDAWIAGIRRDQSRTRRHAAIVERDERFGVVKINPLARWTEREVWAYLRERDLPYNDLHDRGFPSVGCVPCTRAVSPGEDSRAGRWPGRPKIECGLHAVTGIAR